jgi:hypothetical protein
MRRRLSLTAVFVLAVLVLTATGGSAFGPTTVPSTPTQLHVVVRGDDGALWYTAYDGTAWHWESLHGLPTSDASIVASATGQLDVFVRGRDNALWHKVWSGSWGAWGVVGGSLAGEPAAVSSSPGTIDVFVQGTDGALWDSHFDSSGQRWINLGGRLAGAPVAVSSASDTADAFVRGTDNTVWHASVIGSTSTAQRWERVGGHTLETPSVASRTTGLVTAEALFDVFIEGDDQALWHASKKGVYPWVWENLGGRLASRPAAAEAGSAGRARPAALVEGADHRLWQWNGFWQQLGGQLAFRPAAATLAGTVHAFVQGTDNSLWHEWKGNWENLGGRLAAPPCGAPANPWGYTLCGGTFIYTPPSNFCSVFDCVPSFWSVPNGYVTECYDGRYSHAGGRPGTCFDDLGEFRPLWAS